MRRILFIFGLFLVTPAEDVLATDFAVGRLATGQPHIDGSQCQFSDKSGVILKSDWIKNAWMTIDGKLFKLNGTRTDEEAESDLNKNRWRETFRTQDITTILDLKQIGRGEDSAVFKGSITVKRNGIEKQYLVEGGCGA